jgi:hypothetical protein
MLLLIFGLSFQQWHSQNTTWAMSFLLPTKLIRAVFKNEVQWMIKMWIIYLILTKNVFSGFSLGCLAGICWACNFYFQGHGAFQDVIKGKVWRVRKSDRQLMWLCNKLICKLAYWTSLAGFLYNSKVKSNLFFLAGPSWIFWQEEGREITQAIILYRKRRQPVPGSVRHSVPEHGHTGRRGLLQASNEVPHPLLHILRRGINRSNTNSNILEYRH